MNRHWIAFLILAASAPAEAQVVQDAIKLRFADGTVLEVHTESSGATVPRSTARQQAVTPGYDYHRLVLGKDEVLLGYDIEARKTGAGDFLIRMKPTNKDQVAIGERGKWLEIPTITAVREFPHLRMGDTVKVDILQHPQTGEKVFDLLRIAGEGPSARTDPKSNPGRFSLKDARVAVNGKTIREQQNVSMLGGALMIHLPGAGAYYFTLSPPSNMAFRPASWVDHTVLRFYAQSGLVEVFSKTNVLESSDFATVWVYHDPASEGRSAGSLVLACGDDAQSLLQRNRTTRNRIGVGINLDRGSLEDRLPNGVPSKPSSGWHESTMCQVGEVRDPPRDH